MQANWLDRTIRAVAPQAYLKRMRARMAADLTERHYEGAATGRRTQGWRKSLSDPNAASAGALAPLRNVARDLVRNNPYAAGALTIITDHTVGWGIRASEEPQAWLRWAESTACDADGRHDFYGLQKLVLRTVAESGECLIRRRLRRPEDNLPIPFQLQILEPDYLDHTKEIDRLPNGGQIIQGVEFGPFGKIEAYWLFRDHPGSSRISAAVSERVPADGVRQVFRLDRPGQARGVTWFAPVLLTFKDFDELEDATLVKQKVAACLSIVTSDIDGNATPLGTVTADAPDIDTLSPGGILNIAPGRHVDVVQPPSVREYPDYARTQQRKIATGLGLSYEDLTGDYSMTNFSAARMARLRHWAHVEDWRWRLLVPQMLDPVWQWAVDVAGVMNIQMPARTDWNPPPLPMIEPDKEGLAILRNVRAGIQTLSQAIQERGYTRDKFLDELQADFNALDDRGLVLDIDPRKMTQAGQLQQAQPAQPAEETPAAEEDTDDERRARLRLARRA